MNFLEELVAEWYEYKGYFCRTNIRFGRTGHGGHIGEMDVIAYHPNKREFIHIECSTDALSWEQKRIVFRKKFENAGKYYDSEFAFEKSSIEKIAITGFSKPKSESSRNFGLNIKVVLVSEFVTSIAKDLSVLDPWSVGIHESTYPLLRAIQFGTFYLNKANKKANK